MIKQYHNGKYAFALLIFLHTLILNKYTAFANESTNNPVVYFLSIGISSYVDKQFASFDAPKHSAKVVADQLLQSGAKFGLLLTEQIITVEHETKRVSRDDVFNAIAALKAKIISDGSAANARIIIYIASHAYAHKQSKQRFMLPGNLIMPKNGAKLKSTKGLAKFMISDIDIIKSMLVFKNISVQPEYLNLLENEDNAFNSEKFDVPFLLLFDNCADYLSNEKLIIETSDDIDSIYADALKFGRIYYATEPGTKAYTWLLSFEKETTSKSNERLHKNTYARWVGPLAWQFVWALVGKVSSEVMSLNMLQKIFMKRDSDFDKIHLPPRPFGLINSLGSGPLYDLLSETDKGSDIIFFPPNRESLQEINYLEPTGSEVLKCCD
ncbi:hypothetical protein [Lentilitoribacter sp. EG35]|uniref:hypothetical protein n=1 Tax=Lentilitoribacter sp. EG35 TaxID=3234192 RepID=UPI00345F715D